MIKINEFTARVMNNHEIFFSYFIKFHGHGSQRENWL